MSELESWLILSRAPRVGPVSAKAIVAYFGSAEAIVSASNAARNQSKLFGKKALAYFEAPDSVAADLALLDVENVHALYWGHSDYPPLLAEIDDPPLVLFVRGNVSLLSLPQVGIVGSRSADQSGLDIAYDFAKSLSQGGVTVTSGLAMGIDAAAHRGALTGMSGTIAVMGTGLDRIYPAKNKDLAHEIASTGALVTEFGAGMEPQAKNFPRRNRIISGLSLGTLVVQAALRSGSLITARTAMEQGREVFAVPGSIHNPVARGCHHLIKQGASLAESAQDVVDGLAAMLDYSKTTVATKDDKERNQEDEGSVLLQYIDYDPTLIDDLPARSGLDIATINAELLSLELVGKIEMLAGAKVQKL